MNERSLTEKPNPASRDIDLKSTEEILRVIHAEDQKVARAVEKEIPRIARAVDLIVEALDSGGRLFYVGAGTSGRLGVLDAAECPPTFGVDPELVQGVLAGGGRAFGGEAEVSEDDRDSGREDLRARGLSPRDVVVGIAASGRTPYTLAALEYARQVGARTVALSCVPDSELARLAEVAITPATGPEVIAGSTRMKAGTAQKLVLQMLSTAAMIRRGLVYSHWMVNVQTKNEKLRARAHRILVEAAGVSEEKAHELLSQTQELRVALIMARTGMSASEAQQALQAAGYRLRQVDKVR